MSQISTGESASEEQTGGFFCTGGTADQSVVGATKTRTESEVTSCCAGSIASFGTQRFERLDVCGASRREKTGKHRRCSQQGTGYD